MNNETPTTRRSECGQVTITSWREPGVVDGRAGMVEHIVLESRIELEPENTGRVWR